MNEFIWRDEIPKKTQPVFASRPRWRQIPRHLSGCSDLCGRGVVPPHGAFGRCGYTPAPVRVVAATAWAGYAAVAAQGDLHAPELQAAHVSQGCHEYGCGIEGRILSQGLVGRSSGFDCKGEGELTGYAVIWALPKLGVDLNATIGAIGHASPLAIMRWPKPMARSARAGAMAEIFNGEGIGNRVTEGWIEDFHAGLSVLMAFFLRGCLVSDSDLFESRRENRS